ncbi:hypothetical protein D9611_013382 [Ephemerocybe angulata]|uniref:Uncharacterized protein n=1 Tax=Ephemerocybe angulata TaxID=980116 RepID=A0A8H5FIR5_9AGAR|nr:hypothetical protein D9611_013382 [Tulosesus angulatus]
MAQAVARAAAKRPAGVLPPPSPFAELLRRSRFASYDPQVKQTYGTPPAYAHRGNWGLKRPIAQRRRNAYITLKSYEDHAMYIEWNNAENQVRFMRRFEELNVTPTVPDGTSLAKNLGAARSAIWLTDSEFDTAKDNEYDYLAQESTDYTPEPELGGHGPGQYADASRLRTKAPLVPTREGPWNYRQPNVEAMNAQEFEAYVNKLRKLRPQFFERIRQELARSAQAGQLKGTTLNPDMSDLQLSMVNNVTSDHRAFLNSFFESEYSARKDDLAAPDPETGGALPKDFVRPKIKPQPHRFGGLTYAHPTQLETYYTTTAKPAFLLSEDLDKGKFANQVVHKPVSVSFGGVVAELESTPVGTKPLFSKFGGPSDGKFDQSILPVRVAQFELMQAPRVVGRDGQGVNGVRVREKVVNSVPRAERIVGNPHLPGSREYVAYERRQEAKPMNSFWKPRDSVGRIQTRRAVDAVHTANLINNLRSMGRPKEPEA